MIIATLKVVIDAQSWLYANQLKLQGETKDPLGFAVTPEMFEGWQDEWKNSTKAQIDEIMEALNNEDE